MVQNNKPQDGIETAGSMSQGWFQTHHGNYNNKGNNMETALTNSVVDELQH